MDDQNPPSPSPADDSRTLSPLRQSDYEAIESAVMETTKGRWFLAEFARRNRAADTEAVLTAVARLERLIRRERPGDRPSETERMHLDLAEIRDVINRNTSEIDVPAPEASPSAPSVPDHAAVDDAAVDVEAKSPGISGENAAWASGNVQPAKGDVQPTTSVVAVEGEETGEFAARDAWTRADNVDDAVHAPESTDTAQAVTAQAVGEPLSPLPSDQQAAYIETPVPEDFSDEPSDEADDLADETEALARATSNPPAAFIETPVPEDLSDEHDDADDLADETEALARANAAIDDAIETLRGVSGAVAGPPPGRLPDLRTDPIAALPRAERLALFS